MSTPAAPFRDVEAPFTSGWMLDGEAPARRRGGGHGPEMVSIGAKTPCGGENGTGNGY